MLKSGYSRKVILDNAATLEFQGLPRKNALASAYSAARVSYFRRYPGGWLPARLQIPKGRGNKYDYDSRGETVHRALLKNPVSKPNKAIREAIKLQEKFSGNAGHIETIKMPSLPSVGLVIGPLTMIGYSTVENGRVKEYLHQFRPTSRPALVASHDGKSLLIVGGQFRFTERGIVDK